MKKIVAIILFSLRVFAGENQLLVGTTSGYAPFVSLNEKGEYEGFDIDFARALAEKLQKKLVIKDCGSMPNLLLALKQKKVDAIIWAMSITKERSENMEMIYYQGEKVQEMPFLFWKEIPKGIGAIEDLEKEKKMLISVEAESFQEKVLNKYPKLRSKQIEKITDAIMELRFGKCQSAVIDPSLVERVQNQYPEIKVRYLPLKEEDYALGNGICIDKKNWELAEKVRKATEQLIDEGVVSKLEKKWGLN